MATPSNKPRDIKNLKARLGRTITPGQAGAPGSFPPGAPVPGQGAVPPPVVGGGLPNAPAGSVPPPAVPGGGFPGLGAPPFARPGAPGASGRAPGLPGAPAANPFAPTPSPLQPGAAAARPASKPAPLGGGAPAAPRVDPFASAQAGTVPASKKVTLVIDDSAVKEDEIGRKSRMKSAILVVVGVLLGLGVGFGVGNTADKRHQYSMAVQDGKDIYAKVQEVSKNVDQAKTLLKQAVDASSGGPGRKATVDFSAIESLVAMKRPFSANEFHRRLYRAFGDGTVDDLFDYYNNVNRLWDGFAALGAKTAGAARREALNKSAAATDGLLNTDYGVVLSKNGDMLAGALVFLSVPQADPTAKKDDAGDKKKGKGKAEDEGIKVKVASTQGGQEVERKLYTGQDGLGEDFEKYALMLDKVRSRTILGESANLFGKYRGDLMELNAIMDKTGETQGRLMKSLGGIAALSN